MTRFVILLRGVNVGGTRKLPMAALRTAATGAGFAGCATYIQSGNLVLSSDRDRAATEAAIEDLIARDFGFRPEAIARTAAVFAAIAATNPFPDALPKLLHLGLTKAPPLAGADERLRERAQHGERIAIIGDAVWIDFGESGVAGSKLTPAFLDKATGSTLTARNINTVRTLCEMAEGAG